MRLLAAVVLPAALTLTSAAQALGPGDAARGFREGANHHVGDDGFVEDFGRPFGPGDTEKLRMHSHFTHVRRWLGDRKPTKPELAARREEILGYFDEYIAKGTTPKNEHVQWRTPVFIDDHGTICAVGYLIERTVGRDIAEKIAHEHRYSVLEDIAAAMPEVRAWIASSGFTLEELASIQPGYVPPVTWDGRDLTDDKVDGGPVQLLSDAASGTWRSAYPNGSRLAQGPFTDKKPNGTWRFYHPSGNLAARGDFVDGRRDGEWTFFHDAKEPIVKAKGRYMSGSLIEDWKHYDGGGKLVAIARPSSPQSFHGAGYLLDVMPSAEKIRHWIHRGTVAGTKHRLDYLADGTEQLYVHDTDDIAYDAGGHRLARDTQGVWTSSDCHWNKVRRDSARSGDVATLHGLTFDAHGSAKEACSDPKPISEARAKHVEAMLAAIRDAKPSSSGDAWPDVGAFVATNMVSFLAKPDVGTAAAPSALPPTIVADARHDARVSSR